MYLLALNPFHAPANVLVIIPLFSASVSLSFIFQHLSINFMCSQTTAEVQVLNHSHGDLPNKVAAPCLAGEDSKDEWRVCCTACSDGG